MMKKRTVDTAATLMPVAAVVICCWLLVLYG